MTVKELRYICYYVGIMDRLEGAFEKSDVVKIIMSSSFVTVLCPPRETLITYPVRTLRQLMDTLGVSTQKCIEKEDLIKELLSQPFVQAEKD